MKPITGILALLLCTALLSACGGQTQGRARDDTPPDSPSDLLPEDVLTSGLPNPPAETVDYISCRIVDGGGTETLVLAQLDYALPDAHPELAGDGPPNVSHNGRGSALLTLTEDVAVYLDGEPAAFSDLEDGMTVEVACCGVADIDSDDPLTESYIRPISVSGFSRGTVQNLAGTCYDLCGLYLQVLDDLWQKDPALNEDISVAGLDLSQAPGGLLDSEKAAIAYCFGQAHGVRVVAGTWEQLMEQEYFSEVHIWNDPAETDIPHKTLYEWEDGCLFSITPNRDHEGEIYSLPVLFFNAEKWRAPLAAYCFYDCSAGWGELGSWSGYTIGGEMAA